MRPAADAIFAHLNAQPTRKERGMHDTGRDGKSGSDEITPMDAFCAAPFLKSENSSAGGINAPPLAAGGLRGGERCVI